MSKYSWINYIHQRIKNNKNFVCILTGPPGNGKSWTALSIAEQLDPEFTLDRVCFRAKDIMKQINGGNMKSGSVLIWDEAGIDLSNRNWQSELNKVVNFLLQTFRHRNFILIFTTPYSDFVDAATRKLFDAEFETVKILKDERKVRLKAKCLQYNSRQKKFYAKYLRVIKPGVGFIKIKKWDVPAPSVKLRNGYEKLKLEFTSSLNREIMDRIHNVDFDGKRKKPLTLLQKQIEECWKLGIKKQKDIGARLGKTQQQISMNENWMYSKGYFKENY